MIDLLFRKGTQLITIRIIGHELMFAEVKGDIIRYAPIESLRLNVAGILKEFPDLEGKSEIEIRQEGLKRFKEKLKKFNSEEQIKEYLKKDLFKHGYILLVTQKAGFRPKFEKNV